MKRLIKKCFRIIAVLLLIVLLSPVTVPSFAEESNEIANEYNFTYCVRISKRLKKGSIGAHEYGFFFDFDNDIVVVYEHVTRRYNGTNSQDYKIYRMEQDSNGIISLCGFDGSDHPWNFKVKRVITSSGLLFRTEAETTSIIVCDSEGIPSLGRDYFMRTIEVENQPIGVLEKMGFYERFPSPGFIRGNNNEEKAWTDNFILITPENFFDYYELVQNYEYAKDQNGKILSIASNPVFRLKEEYVDRVDAENNDIYCEVAGKLNLHRIKIDWETGLYSVGDKADIAVRKALESSGFNLKFHARAYGVFEICVPCEAYWMYSSDSSGHFEDYGVAVHGKGYKHYQAIPTELEVIRTEGALYFQR